MTADIHDCPILKAEWIKEVSQYFPIGTRVGIIDSDIKWIIGVTGVVTGYDMNEPGEHPMIHVKFDHVIEFEDYEPIEEDGFYEHELFELATLRQRMRPQAGRKKRVKV